MLRFDPNGRHLGAAARDEEPDHAGTSSTPASPSAVSFDALRETYSLSQWSPSRRPARHPVKRVPRRHVRGDHLNGSKDPTAWTLLGIEAADHLGIVRTGMTYNREYGTSAGFFEKPGRVQFLEGPNEPAVADHLEMCPRYLDFQFQPLRLTFRRADDRIIHKYPDVGIEYDDHTVRFGEIKSDDAWFAAEGVRRPLDGIDRAMATEGLGPLLRIRGTAFRSDAVLKAQGIAMEARLTKFDRDADALIVRAVVAAAGGQARHGDLVAAMGGPPVLAVDKLYAMLLRRIVHFDISTEPTGDTPVTAPRPARAFALRELLARFRRKVG